MEICGIEEAISKIKEVIYMSDGTKVDYIDINHMDLGGEVSVDVLIQAIETLLTAYEKEKDLNNELQIRWKIENDKYKREKEENKELKKENKKLNLVRLQYLVSSFPDTTETYKKYKKELDELLKEE